MRMEAIMRTGKAANEGFGYLVGTCQGPDEPTLDTPDDPENKIDSQDHTSAGGGSIDDDTQQEDEIDETPQGPDEPTLDTTDDPENAIDSQDHASAGGGSIDDDTQQEDQLAGVDEATRLLLKALEDEDRR